MDRFVHISLKRQRIAIFITTSLAIILCLTVPAEVDKDFFFDLRHIPLWLGSLNGGPIVAGGLLAVTIIYRGFFGGLGALTTVIVSITIFAISIILNRKFNTLTTKKRIILCVGLSIFSALYTVLIMWLITHSTITFANTLMYVIIQAFGMLMVSYMSEKIKQNHTLRNKIIQTEKLEVVSHLAASISHEVRNPITTSRGFMQLLSEQDIPDKFKDYIKISIDELDRAEQIIRDFLTFAKPDIKKKEILNLRHEIDKSIGILTPLANMNAVKIKTVLTDKLFILGERCLFQQSLINVIKNCLEAMPDGGELEIKTGTTSKHNNAYIMIRDTGMGMTTEQLSRLGEPYFSTKGGKGTGLGMMVVIRIIEAMDGTIEVSSEVGKGSTFTITFPISE